MTKPSKLNSFMEWSIIFFTTGSIISFIGAAYMYFSQSSASQFRYHEVSSPAAPKETPILNNLLTPVKPAASNQSEKLEIITLRRSNTVVLDSVFTDESVQVVMRQLQILSASIPANETIYLVLNTPGGGIDAGLKLITFIKALPQKVKTLTIFAASMGFQTVQQLDERLLLVNGTLMSHRAKLGVQGEAPGELFSRLKWYMTMIDDLDVQASNRMGMTFEAYRELIRDEYWVFDRHAISDKAADRRVFAKCDASLSGTKSMTVDSMFGRFTVEMANCPLIPGIVSMKADSVQINKEAANYIKLMFTNREQFTHDYILTNKYQKFQKAN